MPELTDSPISQLKLIITQCLSEFGLLLVTKGEMCPPSMGCFVKGPSIALCSVSSLM